VRAPKFNSIQQDKTWTRTRNLRQNKPPIQPSPIIPPAPLVVLLFLFSLFRSITYSIIVTPSALFPQSTGTYFAVLFFSPSPSSQPISTPPPLRTLLISLHQQHSPHLLFPPLLTSTGFLVLLQDTIDILTRLPLAACFFVAVFPTKTFRKGLPTALVLSFRLLSPSSIEVLPFLHISHQQ